MSFLGRYLQVLARVISFSSFGVGGLFLAFFVFPVIRFWYRDPKIYTKKIKYVIHKSFAFFVFLMESLGNFDFKIEGREKVIEDGGTLLLANHPSLIDVVVLLSIYPQANCIVKKSLWKNPFMRGVVSGAGYIPGDGADSTLDDCQAALNEGDTLIVFPEGTRTIPGEEMRLKRGASQIALRLNCPIRLAQINSTPSTLTKHEPWYKIPSKKPLFSLKIGDKIWPKNFPTKTKPIPVAARILTREIKHRLEGDCL